MSVNTVISLSRSCPSDSFVLYAPVLSFAIPGPGSSASVSHSCLSALSMMCCWLVLVVVGEGYCGVVRLYGDADLAFVWCRHRGGRCMLAHSSAARVCSSGSSVVWEDSVSFTVRSETKTVRGWFFYCCTLCFIVATVSVRSSPTRCRLSLNS